MISGKRGIVIKIEILMKYLQQLYPQAQTELHFSNPYQCLVAVMLSAQTTDKSVNLVTKPLFSQYDSLEKLDALTESLFDPSTLLYLIL